jgi:hypothetical protein
MNCSLPKRVGLPALLCLPLWCTGQVTQPPDTAFLQTTAQDAKNLYFAAIKTQMHLYNGSQYVDYDPIEEEHPYFVDPDWSNGWIIYDHERYDNTPLLYNISSDKIVAEHYAGAFIDLIATKVTAFHLHNHTFKRFIRSDDKRGGITEGFYDVMYDGKVKIVARRTKKFTQVVHLHEYENSFEERNHYYVVRDQSFFPIRSKKSMLEVLGDQKQALKQFARANKLSFKKAREQSMVKLAAYYDTLIP